MSAYPGKVDTDIGFTRYRRIKAQIGNIRFAWFSEKDMRQRMKIERIRFHWGVMRSRRIRSDKEFIHEQRGSALEQGFWIQAGIP
jgi:hypothetical protein